MSETNFTLTPLLRELRYRSELRDECLRLEEIGYQLNLKPDKIKELIISGEILALEYNGSWLIPKLQISNGEIDEQVSRLQKALGPLPPYAKLSLLRACVSNQSLWELSKQGEFPKALAIANALGRSCARL